MNLLTEIEQAITSALDESNVGWQGYLWRNFNFNEPTASCPLNLVSPDLTVSQGGMLESFSFFLALDLSLFMHVADFFDQ